MKKRLLYSFLLSLLAIMLFALPVLAAYIANITILETGSNSYTSLPLIYDIDVDYLVTENYIDADGLDTRVATAGGVNLPHLLADDKILFVTDVNADSSSSLNFLTGQTPATYMPIITGYGGKFGIADTAAMELGNDFEIELSGYFDTTAGVSKDIITKTGVINVYVDTVVDGTVNFDFIGTAKADKYLFPTGAGGIQDFSANPAVAHHLNVDDAPGAADDATTTVYKTNAGGYERFTVTASGGSLQAGDTINSITVYYRIYGDGGDDNDAYLSPSVTLGGSSNYGSWQDCTGTWTTRNEALARPGGGSWTVADLASLQIGVMKNGGTEDCWVTQIYAVVNYTPVRTLSVAGIAAGEHTIKVYADTVNAGIIIDEGEAGEASDTMALNGASVIDNANAWVFMDNSTTQFTSYWNYYTHTVGGTLITNYQPVGIIVGTILVDEENSNDATITWGSNPAGIAITLGSFIPSTQPAIPGGIIGEGGQDLAGETGTGDLTADTGTLTTNPFYPIIHMIADNTGFTVQLVWLTIATLLVSLSMIAVFSFVPHQLITVIVGAAVTGVFIALGIYPFWTIFVFVFSGIAVVLWERVPSV